MHNLSDQKANKSLDLFSKTKWDKTYMNMTSTISESFKGMKMPAKKVTSHSYVSIFASMQHKDL